jgi:hypothetical protein
MLKLINSLSQIADLYPDTTIPIERNNPLFNEDDKLFADITYGFKLPLTPHNLEFIKNGHLIEAENRVYAQEVTAIIDGTPIHSGSLTYKITASDIDALLLINYGLLAEKAKKVKLSEIYTGDTLPNPYDEVLMKLVCLNPQDHPYSFFPVYNDSWNPTEENNQTPFINNWDHEAQNFNITDTRITCPYFKLKYLISKVMDFLGFVIDGDYLTDPESEEIFVYTRITSGTLLNGCFTYLPTDLTVEQFLITIKERFHISCNFDMITSKVNIVTPNSAINYSKVQDLRDYVTSIDEISLTEAKGYSIILTPDEQDELFLDTTSPDEDTYSPTNRLVIGNREKPIEMESSTLKVKTFETYSMPAAKQTIFVNQYKIAPFPLRFLRYKGMQPVIGGKVFPQAYPMELTLDDAMWYKFLNESKVVKLKITIPAFMLASLKVHQRIEFYSKEGNYTIALLEKVSYNLLSSGGTHISASIQCRAMVNNFAPDAQIIDYTPDTEPEDPDSTGLIPITYKAFFDKNVLPAVNIEVRFSNTSGGRAGRETVQRGSILTSTDRFGTSGMVIAPRLIITDNCELRVLTGTPIYLILGGLKFYFLERDGYHYVNLYTLTRSPYEIQGVWIIYEDLS